MNSFPIGRNNRPDSDSIMRMTCYVNVSELLRLCYKRLFLPRRVKAGYLSDIYYNIFIFHAVGDWV